MHVFALGASGTTGYQVALRLLQRGDNVSVLLRNPQALEQDEVMNKYITDRKLMPHKGDAMRSEDVIAAWNAAKGSPFGSVEAVVFTIGPASKMTLRGVTINPPNVCAVAYFNTLLAIAGPADREATPPKLIVVSQKSVTPGSMRSTPAPLRHVISWMLRYLNLDKRGMEALVFHGWGKEYEKDMTPTPEQGILPSGWETQLPPPGWAKSAVLIRPPELTKGAETGRYRTDLNDFFVSRISRKDLAAFIVNKLLGDEAEWRRCEGEVVTIGY